MFQCEQWKCVCTVHHWTQRWEECLDFSSIGCLPLCIASTKANGT